MTETFAAVGDMMSEVIVLVINYGEAAAIIPRVYQSVWVAFHHTILFYITRG